jgi:hypothetical protein
VNVSSIYLFVSVKLASRFSTKASRASCESGDV